MDRRTKISKDEFIKQMQAKICARDERRSGASERFVKKKH